MALEDPMKKSGIIYKKYVVTRLDDYPEPKYATYFPVKIGVSGTSQAIIAYIQKLNQNPIHKNSPFVSGLWALARAKSFIGFKNNGFKPVFKIEKTDGTTDPDAKYFVFEISEDEDARYALEVYAEVISSDSPRMARDLKELIKAKNWKLHGYEDEAISEE